MTADGEDETVSDADRPDPPTMSETNNPDSTDSKFDAERVDVPGRASIHDKRTNPNNAEIDHYACPFCDYTEDTEHLVRAHITFEDDAAHRNRNGFLDQIFVHGIDADGDVVEDIELKGEEKSPGGTLSTDLLPDNLTDKQESILSVAVVNPELSISQLTKKVADQTDYDNPTPSYIGSTVKKHLSMPDRDDSGGKSNRGYDDLTDKQQAVIDRIVTFENPTDPDSWPETRTTVAEEAGYSGGSIIPSLLDKYGDIIQHRKAAAEAREERTATSPAPAEETSEATSEAEDTQEGASASPSDVYSIEKDRLSKFAARFAQIQESSEKQIEIAPSDSLMSGHAQGKLEVVEVVEEFLRAVRDDNAAEDDD